jgi:hypothetical protein
VSSSVNAQGTDQWPDITIPNTFKASGVVNTWDGTKLTPFQGASGTLLVDSGRNKAMIHAKVGVPLFGNVDANLLIDYTRGEAITYIPFLNVCTLDRFNQTLNLTEEFGKARDRTANLTTYLGEISPPWDRLTPSYKFSSQEQVDNITYSAETYFEKASKALKWVSYRDNDVNKQFVIALGKNGLIPATFSDSDFKLQGCSPTAQLIV